MTISCSDKLILPVVRQEVAIEAFDDIVGGRLVARIGGRHFAIYPSMAALIEYLKLPRTLRETQEFCASTFGRSNSVEEIRSLVYEVLPRAFFNETDNAAREPFDFRITVLGPAATAFIARPLQMLFNRQAGSVIAVLFVILTATHVTPILSASTLPLSTPAILFLFTAILITTLLHELGHAAACLRFGKTPGAIGLALYLMFPVFYTNVSVAWMLPRRQRAIVDAGGLTVDALVVSILLIAANLCRIHALYVIVYFKLLAMAYNGNVILKMDGYWLLTDLLGVTNLHASVLRALKQRFQNIPLNIRLAALALAASSVIFAIMMGAFLLSTIYYSAHVYPHLISKSWSSALASTDNLNIRAFMAAVEAMFAESFKPIVLVVLFLVILRRKLRRPAAAL